MSNREKVSRLEFVKVALESGFKPDSYNAKATRHFRFVRSTGTLRSVEISYYVGNNAPAFTVGDTYTGYEPHAIELLRAG